VSVSSQKSRVAYILLGLFLGGLGIHNFYAGYTGRAVAQLLITLLTGWLIVPILIVGIWVLIEVITVTSDAQGLPFN
jgi:TM2 domain-containing membrane protein YozV